MENRKKQKETWKKIVAALVAVALIVCGAFGASYAWGLKNTTAESSVLASISAPEMSEFEDDITRAVFDMLKDQVSAEVSAQISLWESVHLDGNTNVDMASVTDYMARMLAAIRGDINAMVAAEIQNLDFSKLTDEQIAVIADRVAAMIADGLLSSEFASKYNGQLDTTELQALIAALSTEELRGLKARLDEAEADMDRMTSDYDALVISISQALSKIQKDGEKTDKTLNDLSTRITNLTTRMSQQIASINGTLDGKLNVSTFNTFLDEYKGYLADLDAVIKRIDDAEGRLNDAEVSIKDAMGEIDSIKEELDALDAEMTEKINTESRETRSIIESLREATSASMSTIEQKIRDLTARVANNENEIQQLKDERVVFSLEPQADGSYRLYIDDPQGPRN